MNQLPNWVIVNPRPAVHDYESVTAIEMVAKLYGAMQQLIDECNKLEGTFTEFAKSEEEKRTDFETDAEQVMREFVCKVEQDVQSIRDEVAKNMLEVERVVTEQIVNAIAAGTIEITQSYDASTEALKIAVSEL